jgi:hypothetical protein
LLDGLAFCAVVTVILAAKSLGSLQSLGLAVYNLRGVVPDMKRAVSLEHVTALIARHRFPLCPTNKARIAVYATSMQRFFGNMSVTY